MLTNAMQLVRAALRDRAGVSSIEYGVLALGIIGVLSAAMLALGTDLTNLWAAVENMITGAI